MKQTPGKTNAMCAGASAVSTALAQGRNVEADYCWDLGVSEGSRT
jgi:hypothetical protein